MPTEPPSTKVKLREITGDNVRDVIALKVTPEQERFVAPNTVSIAEAYAHEMAWVRAIYSGDTPVGLVMLHDENLKKDPERFDFYFLWRLMIDGQHQRRGYAARAVELVIEHVMANPNARELLVSYMPGKGAPAGFYEKLEFKSTGRMVGGEIEMTLKLR